MIIFIFWEAYFLAQGFNCFSPQLSGINKKKSSHIRELYQQIEFSVRFYILHLYWVAFTNPVILNSHTPEPLRNKLRNARGKQNWINKNKTNSENRISRHSRSNWSDQFSVEECSFSVQVCLRTGATFYLIVLYSKWLRNQLDRNIEKLTSYEWFSTKYKTRNEYVMIFLIYIRLPREEKRAS